MFEIEAYKALFHHFDASCIERLDKFYAPDVVFRDPIHEVRGLDSIRNYFADLADGLALCRFDYLEHETGAGWAFIKWDMTLRHPRLNGGKEFTVRGLTHLRFDTHIRVQEDFYDMGAMIYERVPLIGSLVGWLRRRLSADADPRALETDRGLAA